MPTKDTYIAQTEAIEKRIAALSHELSTLRAGRANPGVLDKLQIDYYGTLTPIQQVATVSVPDPRTLMITPWDIQALKLIEKAILASDLGINPTNDGKAIRLAFPSMTEERRKELIKMVGKYTEEAKISLRSIRRDAIEGFKADKKKGDITEDDLKVAEKDIQDILDKYIKEVDNIAAKKEKELMEV